MSHKRTNSGDISFDEIMNSREIKNIMRKYDCDENSLNGLSVIVKKHSELLDEIKSDNIKLKAIVEKNNEEYSKLVELDKQNRK